MAGFLRALAGSTKPIHTPVILDPVNALTSVAILYFRPDGTKLAISEGHRVYRDTPGMGQSFKRFYYGSGHSEHYDLAVALFHACNWFRPDRNKAIRQIFETAILGIEKLALTYANDPSAAHYLFLCHIKILEAGLAPHDEPLNGDAFRIPNWSGNPIASKSCEVWCADDLAELKAINEAFALAIAAKKKDAPFESHIEYIKGIVSANCTEVDKVKKALLSGAEIEEAKSTMGCDKEGMPASSKVTAGGAGCGSAARKDATAGASGSESDGEG
ncbi:MAG: hypothetical protein P0S95_06915 [Rhabdochlamydiaceae bacterium]|nr:hypothetical protein [Candidatus Amphrikana amoebophyrae]